MEAFSTMRATPEYVLCQPSRLFFDEREPIDFSGSPQSLVDQAIMALLEDAVRRRASDVHLEPRAGRLRVRYRIDGQLYPGMELQEALNQAFFIRLRTMAGIEIGAKHRIGEGRFSKQILGRQIDVRLALLTCIDGETAVLRLLEVQRSPITLDELGLTESQKIAYEASLHAAEGLILTVGPTGAGKTTTLYASLQVLARRELKLISIEDPVEMVIPKVNQVAVSGTGLTFAKALRSILRQAPNIIMVGELRDPETAALAINAALTGHLVLASLHAEDGPAALERLMNLGASRSLIAQSIRAVLAQRLLPKICSACKSVSSLQAFCPQCHGVGVYGRVPIFELLTMTPELRLAFGEGVSTSQFKAQAKASGWVSLKTASLEKVNRGEINYKNLQQEFQ